MGSRLSATEYQLAFQLKSHCITVFYMDTHWAIDLGTTNTLIAKWVGTHATTIALDELVEYEPVRSNQNDFDA